MKCKWWQRHDWQRVSVTVSLQWATNKRVCLRCERVQVFTSINNQNPKWNDIARVRHSANRENKALELIDKKYKEMKP
jgi:hypothetical protein